MSSVVITGNARGFGYAMTELFYEKGFDVVLCDISETAIQEAKAKLEKLNKGKIIPIQCDITNEEQVQNLIEETIKQLGTIKYSKNNEQCQRFY